MSWLEGKTVVVTGAGGGIGSTACQAFAAAGSTVVGFDLDDGWLPAVRERAGGAGRLIHALVGDATDAKAVSGAVQHALELTDRLDVAVAGAGIQAVGSVEDTSEETWQRVIDVNLTATWLLCK